MTIILKRAWHRDYFNNIAEGSHITESGIVRAGHSRREIAGMVTSFNRALSHVEGVAVVRNRGEITMEGYSNLGSYRLVVQELANRNGSRSRNVINDIVIPAKYNYLLEGIDNNLTFGIEFEFAGSICREDLADRLQSAGLRHRVRFTSDCHGSNVNTWWVQCDNTPNTNGQYSYPTEIASPKLKGHAGVKEVYKLLKFLRENNLGKVLGGAGMHVHHGSFGGSESVANRIFDFYKGNSSQIDKIIAPSRRGRGCSYCYSLDDITFNRSLSMDNKYRFVSFRKFHQNGTFEARQHQGSLNFEKAINWVIFVQGIIRQAMVQANLGSQVYSNLVQVISNIGIAPQVLDSVTEHYYSRMQTLAQE